LLVKEANSSNKFVNVRPSGWTALNAASQQSCPLQKRYILRER
jgi:pyridoxine/pyridoxamine 5'-phosphate oxidase